MRGEILFGQHLEQIIAQSGNFVMQGLESMWKIVIGMGNAGQGEHAMLKPFDCAPRDFRFAEITECLTEEFEFTRHRSARFGNRFNEHGKILRGNQIGVPAAQAEVRFEKFDLAQRMHIAGAGRLVKKIGEIEEIDHAGEGAFWTRGTLGNEGESPRFLAEAAHDQAGVAKRHSRDDETSGGLRIGHAR